MTEKYVKLSDVKDVLAEAGLVAEYYDGKYLSESVSGYNVDDVNKGLAEIQTADVAPVRHAHWKLISTRKNEYSFRFIYKCSGCGRVEKIYSEEPLQISDIYPYCHCGAKMDEEENK